MRTFCVYVHKRPDGSPFYVGKGSLKRARSMRRRNEQHAVVVREYGLENIRVGVIRDRLDEELAFLAERELVDVLKRRGFSLTNMTNGGEGLSGWRMTEEAKRHLSIIKKGIPGIPHSQQTKDKIAKAHLGRMIPQEVRRKISATQKGRQYALGQKRSKESRERIAIAVTGHTLSAESRAKIGAAFLGKTISEEHKRKISEGVKKNWKLRKERIK